MRYAFDDAGRRRPPHDAVLRDVRQPRHLPRGLDRGHPPRHAVADRRRLPPFDDDVWELYDTTTDWTQAHDLAAEMPDQLAELQAALPRRGQQVPGVPARRPRTERVNPDLAGRPKLIQGNSQLLFGGMGRLTENAVINIKNKSHAVTAQLELTVRRRGCRSSPRAAHSPAGASTSRTAGRSTPTTSWHALFTIDGQRHPAGSHQVRMEFAYDGGGLAKGGTVTLYVDGEQVGEGRVEATIPMVFSGDETCDVGSDTGSPVTTDYTPNSRSPAPQVGADRHRRRRRTSTT